MPSSARLRAKNLKPWLILNLTTITISVLGLAALFFLVRLMYWKQRCKLVEKTKEEQAEAFKALSHDALEQNSRSFLDLAKTSLEKYQESAKGDIEKKQQAIDELLKPVKEGLGRLDLGLKELEKERKSDHLSLKAQVGLLAESEKQLKKETENLTSALRRPDARGRWGEMQLRRVVELAGMINHCDFFEQETVAGGIFRPDMVIHLPGGRQVIIDAKTPLDPYLDAVQAESETEREKKLDDFVRGIRGHVAALGKKSYYEHFDAAPEFVVLFLPSEHFFSQALQRDPSLIEVGAEKNVIIATPTTLIALLRSVAYGWKQENLSRHAELVRELGADLYKRMLDMTGHFTKMGRGLTQAVEAYNKGVGSLERRVLPTARKFQELGATATQVDVDEMPVIDKQVRELSVHHGNLKED